MGRSTDCVDFRRCGALTITLKEWAEKIKGQRQLGSFRKVHFLVGVPGAAHTTSCASRSIRIVEAIALLQQGADRLRFFYYRDNIKGARKSTRNTDQRKAGTEPQRRRRTQKQRTESNHGLQVERRNLVASPRVWKRSVQINRVPCGRASACNREDRRRRRSRSRTACSPEWPSDRSCRPRTPQHRSRDEATIGRNRPRRFLRRW